jgi:GTP-binding protein
MRFIDQVEIEIEAGHGGPGCIAFRREAFVPFGGPNGGDGGPGGDVWLVADANLATLLDFRYRRAYRAPNGRPGEGSQRTGAAGESIRLRVPIGTLVFDAESDAQLCDLVGDGQEFLAARGGKGGRGNYRFRSARDQAPRKADVGMPGQRLRLRLELKLLADVGLVGFPNAGKSTLLSVLTAAKPKIADYPFTTLVPNLGILDLGDYRSCVLADIPGLIEGAAEGKGLGHAFLRHVERTRCLLFLLDVTDEPAARYAALCQEIERYGDALRRARHLVCLSKLDLWPQGADLPRIETPDPVLGISSVTGTGLAALRHRIAELLAAQSAAESVQD